MKRIAMLLSAVMLTGCVSLTEQTDKELCFGYGRAESEAMRDAILQEMQERQDAGMFPIAIEECKKQVFRGIQSRNESNLLSASMIGARYQQQ
ncbi:hypothetical protein [Escherichia phage PJNS034]